MGSDPARFDEFIRITLDLEGVFSNQKGDPGGETWFGIARAKHPEVKPWPPSREQAIGIYHSSYWLAVRADELPAPLDLLVADCAVNQGVGAAGRLLQSLMPEVVQDGVIGPKTAAKTHAMVPDIVPRFLTARAFAYMKDSAWEIDGHGWYNRLFRLAIRVGAPQAVA